MSFLNNFADALHLHNLTLSVDIAGCCGWVDTEHPKAPAGHCAGAFASHEFVGTTCPMYKASRLDRVYGMSTYGDAIDGPHNSTHGYGPKVLMEIASAARQAIGPDKYATGFKSGWPYCGNATDPSTCIFDDVAKESIRR